jgi:hypothetical protein
MNETSQAHIMAHVATPQSKYSAPPLVQQPGVRSNRIMIYGRCCCREEVYARRILEMPLRLRLSARHSPVTWLRMLLPRRLGMSLDLDIRLGTRTRTVRAYCVFTHLQTLGGPSLYSLQYTKLSCIASRMATQRDVEHNQMFLNACVQVDGV